MKKSIIFALLTFCTSFSAAIFAVEPTGDVTFQDLLKQFPKNNLPYSLSAETLKHELLVRYGIEKEEKNATQKTFNGRLNYKYRQLLPDMSRFSRAPLMPTPIAALETSTNYALIYTIDRYDVEYRVAIYNKAGEFLHKRVLASAHKDAIQSALIDENLNATITTHAIIWERDVEKEGYEKNKVKSFKVQKTEIVDITLPENTEKQEKKSRKTPISPKVPPVQQQKQPAVIRA
jgi:hypothetical protein